MLVTTIRLRALAAFVVALTGTTAAAGSGLSSLACDTPLQGNACLVLVCPDCGNRPVGQGSREFSWTVSAAALESLGYARCRVLDLNVAVDLTMTLSRGQAESFRLLLHDSNAVSVLSSNPCGSGGAHALFDDDAPGPTNACPAVGRVRPASPLWPFENTDLARTWTLDVFLFYPKTAGVLEGLGLAADVQCEATPTSGCVPGATTACLNRSRFRVKTTFRTSQGASGDGQAKRLTGDTAWFWFFDRNNVEMVLKVIDGCALNGRYWVFASGLTDIELGIDVVDGQTGRSKRYTNPLSHPFAPILDTDAFPCN